MNHEAFERRYAQLGRALAHNLIAWAKDRKDENKKAIASNNTELCSLYREEQVEAQRLIDEKESKQPQT